MKKRTILLFSCLFCFQCLSFAQETEVTGFQMEIEGKQRKYLFYLPSSVEKDAPLVFVLHGYGGTAEGMLNFSGMNAVADKHKFAVCYPQGYMGPDNKNSWNAGYSNDDVDDVKFLTELALHLQSSYGLSAENTFCTGMSNGADMCYLLACNSPHVFAAIAPVAGCMMEETYNACKPEKSIPVFETHGTDDEITLWMGDSTYSQKYGGYFGVQKVIQFWQEKNQCNETMTYLLPDKNKQDNSFIVAEKHKGEHNQVWLYTLLGGKHDWPGAWGNMDINMAEEIWSFFSLFSKE